MRYLVCLFVSVLLGIGMFAISKEISFGGGKVIDSCGILASPVDFSGSYSMDGLVPDTIPGDPGRPDINVFKNISNAFRLDIKRIPDESLFSGGSPAGFSSTTGVVHKYVGTMVITLCPGTVCFGDGCADDVFFGGTLIQRPLDQINLPKIEYTVEGTITWVFGTLQSNVVSLEPCKEGWRVFEEESSFVVSLLAETVPCEGQRQSPKELVLQPRLTNKLTTNTGGLIATTDIGFGFGLIIDGQISPANNVSNNPTEPLNCTFNCTKDGEDANLGECIFTPCITTAPVVVRTFAVDLGGIPKNPTLQGTIKGEVNSALPVVTIDDNDVQIATVRLFNQRGFVRGQKSEETDEDFKAFLELKRANRTQVGADKKITADDKGLFSYEDISIFESTSSGVRPVYYSVEVTDAQSEEIEINNVTEGTVTTTLFFTSNVAFNLRPDVIVNEIKLTPFDGIGTKMELANSLSGTNTVNNYKQIEARVIRFLDNLMMANPENTTEKLTGEIFEGLNRAIWAERVVLDGSVFADQLITLSLAGFGAVLADVYDEIVGFYMKGKSSVDKDMKIVDKQFDAINKGQWKLDNNPTLKKQLQKHLEGLKQRKEDASFIEDILINSVKVILAELEGVLILNGVTPDTADKIKGVTEKSLVFVLKSLQSAALNGFTKGAALKGGLLKAAKFIIPEVVNLAKPIVLDDRVLSSYTNLTAPFLKHSVDKFIGSSSDDAENNIEPWNKSDPTQFKIDRDKVVETMKREGDEVSKIIQTVQRDLGIAEGFDTVEAGAAFLGAAPPLKWLKVIEISAKALKFAGNTVAAARPFGTAFTTVPDFVKRGVFEAYGEDVPESLSRSTSIQTKRADKSVDQLYVTNADIGLASTVSVSSAKFSDVLNKLSDNLRADDIGAALELTGGDSADSYINVLSEFNQNVSLFMTQASGTGQNLMDLLEEQMDFKLLEAEVGDRITELYLQIMTLGFKDPEDIIYITERNKILSVIDSLLNKMNQFETSLEDMKATIGSTNIIPAIAVQSVTLISDETGENTINLSPEVFALHSRVRNLSNVPVSGLSAGLTVNSARESITTLPSLEFPIDIGTLAADDGVDGTGPDEKEIEWKISYEGDLSMEVVFISVNLLENGETASSFVTNEKLSVLSVDPSVSDKDLDFMPDSLEMINGLDVTIDDALEDKDNDGLINFIELVELGTNPQNPDTDGDGLTDGEEVTGGEDGFVTDPFTPDTDGDGVLDNSDGQPVDGGTSKFDEADETSGVGNLAVDTDEVTLTSDKRVLSVQVTNIGTGILTWSALSDNEVVALVSPVTPETRLDDGLVLVSVSPDFNFDIQGILETTVRIFNVADPIGDFKEITVKVGSGEERMGPDEGEDPTPGVDTASVSGTINNETGDPVEGAVVMIKSRGFEEEMITNQDGFFEFIDLEPKRHTIIIEAVGFKNKKVRVKLSKDENLDLGVVTLMTEN